MSQCVCDFVLIHPMTHQDLVLVHGDSVFPDIDFSFLNFFQIELVSFWSFAIRHPLTRLYTSADIHEIGCVV